MAPLTPPANALLADDEDRPMPDRSRDDVECDPARRSGGMV